MSPSSSSGDEEEIQPELAAWQKLPDINAPSTTLPNVYNFKEFAEFISSIPNLKKEGTLRHPGWLFFQGYLYAAEWTPEYLSKPRHSFYKIGISIDPASREKNFNHFYAGTMHLLWKAPVFAMLPIEQIIINTHNVILKQSQDIVDCTLDDIKELIYPYIISLCQFAEEIAEANVTGAPSTPLRSHKFSNKYPKIFSDKT